VISVIFWRVPGASSTSDTTGPSLDVAECPANLTESHGWWAQWWAHLATTGRICEAAVVTVGHVQAAHMCPLDNLDERS
jgi:hypothetical protein